MEDAPSGNREYDTFFGGGVDTMSTLRSFTEGWELGIAGKPTATTDRVTPRPYAWGKISVGLRKSGLLVSLVTSKAADG